jgi:hypothetical protein
MKGFYGEEVEHMETVERLRTVEAWVAWLRTELDREVDELIASLAADGAGSLLSSAFAARAGQDMAAERVAPLLAGLDEVQRQLQFAQIEAAQLEATEMAQ